MAKIETRRLEKVYRLTHTIIAYRGARIQSVAQRRIYQTAYTGFWSNAISNCSDTKSLWRKMNLLLQPMESTTSPHSADDLSSYFTGKVDTIRASTAGAPPPTIRPRPVSSLRCFDGVTVDEVTSLILRVPPKQCDLDPVPTWLVKKCCDTLAPVITSMTSMSFRQGVFPDTHKHALVRPRIKKPTLDPLDVKSF